MEKINTLDEELMQIAMDSFYGYPKEFSLVERNLEEIFFYIKSRYINKDLQEIINEKQEWEERARKAESQLKKIKEILRGD